MNTAAIQLKTSDVGFQLPTATHGSEMPALLDWASQNQVILTADISYPSKVTSITTNLWTWTFTTDNKSTILPSFFGGTYTPTILVCTTDSNSKVTMKITKLAVTATYVPSGTKRKWTVTQSVQLDFDFTNAKRSGLYNCLLNYSIDTGNYISIR